MSLSSSKTFLLSKYRGSLIGCLCGDAYGALFEQNDSAAVNNVDPSTILDHINKYMACKATTLNYTDDTVMTKAACWSLIENKGLSPEHLARSFAEAYFKEPDRGYGFGVQRVFKQLADEKYQDPYGPASRQFNGSGSFGNGAAMRVSGVALFAFQKDYNSDSVVTLVEECSKITHTHLEAVHGAIMLALGIRYLLPLKNDTLDENAFINFLIVNMERMEPISATGGGGIYARKLRQIREILADVSVRGQDVTPAEVSLELGNNTAASNSVPLAIYSFLRGASKFTDAYQIDNEFLRTLHWTISCGGDTDTIGAMACSLMGAYVGLECIPEDLYTKCEAWQEMITIADRMIEL